MKGERDFFFIFLIFLIIFFSFLNIKVFKERKEIEEEAKILKAKIENLVKKKKEIEDLLKKVNTEVFWEERAREQGFIKEGEESVIIKFK